MKHKKNKEIKIPKEAEEIRMVSPIEEEAQRILDMSGELKKSMQDYYSQMVQDENLKDAPNYLNSIRRANKNMSKALTETLAVQDEFAGRMSDLKRQRKKIILYSAPANATIDLVEKDNRHFATGLNLYKMLWIFFLGSFFGVVVEMLWCLVRYGYLESRAGLVYGPFNILYGMGAAILTACLYKFRNRSGWISLIGGMIVGSVVEYVCSWGQEFVFGTRSWDYSEMPFNINGRICLMYSFFWGLLGVAWVKNLYPRMAKLILKIPNKIGKIITWIVAAFFLINIVMSGLSLTRWMQRHDGMEPANAFWEFIDERFPDERMERVYANMSFWDD